MASNKKPKILYVEWIDSVGLQGGIWHSKGDAVALEPGRIHSVGFLAMERPNSITLVPHDGPSDASGTISIPKSAIKKRRVLK